MLFSNLISCCLNESFRQFNEKRRKSTVWWKKWDFSFIWNGIGNELIYSKNSLRADRRKRRAGATGARKRTKCRRSAWIAKKKKLARCSDEKKHKSSEIRTELKMHPNGYHSHKLAICVGQHPTDWLKYTFHPHSNQKTHRLHGRIIFFFASVAHVSDGSTRTVVQISYGANSSKHKRQLAEIC